MTKSGRIPHLLAACALALVVAGCGVDAKDSNVSSNTTLPKVDLPTTTVDKGTDTTEAPDDTTTTAPEDETTTTADKGSDSTVTIPSGMEETFKTQLESGFKAAGLTDEQAKCLADSYVKEFGTDVGSSSDYTKMLDLFTSCGVSPSDLGGLGGGN
ncbi:hypothetical protein KSP35_04925 [Aquihabitans sp. G128]|uniref:hypothetical protein n=1 Tax=Aquihabitans sp. G128 TaxID=2849779 RepID=UPI001C228682|nr:hypothetical protein [Aquihabitans sp. G128]QXC62156.1 hypothetical protein KSP35_04925 [Aquihabitans sp. G128]